jgi:hypothetical protein
LSVVKMTDAARRLFNAIQQHVPRLAPNRIVKPLKRGEGARALAEGEVLPDSMDPRRNRKPTASTP